MRIGEKIKSRRKALKMTQSELAGDFVTRNMICKIESGSANPSLETIEYIAHKLHTPVSYLVSCDDDLHFYEKNAILNTLYNAFEHGEFNYCIKKIIEFDSLDNELALILAESYLAEGKNAFARGSMNTAVKLFNSAIDTADKTVFQTGHIVAISNIYKSCATNVCSPLFEFSKDDYFKLMHDEFDMDMYRYLHQDYSHEYKDECMGWHIKAKRMIKERRYSDAIVILRDAADYALKNKYNSFVVFGIYTDLEFCFKQMNDFESAYRYSSKRMSMLEGFTS